MTCEIPQGESRGALELLMLMEDAMTNPDNNTLYVLISSLLGAVVSLSSVWYSAAAYALVWLPNRAGVSGRSAV